MHSPQQGFAVQTNCTFNFNYLSPQHVTTVLFSPKFQPSKIHIPYDKEPLKPFKSVKLQDLQSSTNYVENQLDTTIDTINEVLPIDSRQNCHKKPLCHSVIVTETHSNVSFNQKGFKNQLEARTGKERTINTMKRSCMPGSFSQNTLVSGMRLQHFGKENSQFVKFNQNQAVNKPFCFSKNKFPFKKQSYKLSNAKIQDFEVGVLLGRGSIGRVYLARHLATNCYFALKKILKTEVKDKNQFCYSVKCHLFLHSPHIVQVYACFSDEESIYLLMELCPDGNLAKYKKGIKHDSERNKIILGTAKGIQAMHRHHMRHGDLKLENVLMSFGLAKITDLDCVFTGTNSCFKEERKESQLWGSPAYFSPDMIKNSVFSLTDDIWALGVIMYELFTKFHPFTLLGSEDLSKIVEREMSPLPPCLKDTTKKILTAMLSKDTSQRATLEQIIDYCQSSLQRPEHR